MFRAQTSVTLPPGGATVLVREITPLLAQKLHSVLLDGLETPHKDVTAKDLANLLVGNARLKLELLQECCDLEQEVHSLGALAFMRLWQAFEEVNTPFLEHLGNLLQRAAPRQPEMEQAQNPQASP